MYSNYQSSGSVLIWGLWLIYSFSTYTQGQSSVCSFHHEEEHWISAVRTCNSEGSDLLCYSDRKKMMNIIRAFLGDETYVKIWLSSRNCALFEMTFIMEACLYLNVNKTAGDVWPFFQRNCDEMLPFICCTTDNDGISTRRITEETTSQYNTTTQAETSSASTSTTEKITTNSARTTPDEKTSTFLTSRESPTSSSTTTKTHVSTQTTTTTPEEKITTSVTSRESPTSSSTTTKTHLSTQTSDKILTSFPTTYPTTNTVLSTPTESSTLCPTLYCEGTTRRGIEWPDSLLGKEISRDCPGNSIGMAKWMCNMSGYWTPESPDMNECQSLSVLNIKEKYLSLPVDDIVDELDKILNAGSDVYGNDLMDIVSITASLPDKLYEETASLPDKERWSITAESVTTTTSIIDNIVGRTDTWEDLSQEKTVETGSNILKMVDDFGVLLADALFGTDVHNIVTRFIRMQVLRVPFGGEVQVPRGEKDTETNGESINLKEGFDGQLDINEGNLSAVYVRYSNMNHILLSSEATKKKGEENILNSAVSSAVVSQGRSVVSISTEAEISLKHLVSEPNDTACVFWNLDRNDWDTTGCRLKSSNSTHSTCICDHLTNFALLMDFQGRITDIDSLPFFYITVIGCSISIVCLALSIQVFICYSCHARNVWGLRYTIHRNLCLTLLIANILLVTGLRRTNNQMTCSIIAGLLHYFFLSAFSWMLLEGFHIYLLLVVVFASKRSHWQKYYMFGYGFPLLIVAITVIARPDGYGTDKVCWLSVEKGVIWSFGGPVAFILTVNCCALILAQWKASKMSTKDNNIALVKRWLRVTLILFPILGITWLLGFFYVGKHFEVTAYLFALLNSLQGFCIFICHCVLDTKARNLVLNSLRKKHASVTTESSGTLKKFKAAKKEKIICRYAASRRHQSNNACENLPAWQT